MKASLLVPVILMLALVATPLTAEAQQPGKIARVGILSPTTPVVVPRALRQRLHELGWVEGRSFILELRFADGRPGRLPTLAGELVRLNVDVIVAVGQPAIRAAKDATGTIPVVMAFSGVDPVTAGFVASLARPGGNVTGLAILSPDLAVKRLEVLKAALPGAGRVAVLVNPRNESNVEQFAALSAAAGALSVQLKRVEVGRSGDYAPAFAVIAKDRPDAIVVAADPEFFRDRRTLVDLAAQARLPTSYDWRDFVEGGGLMSYGVNLEDLMRRVAYYVDRILKGARPSELPVEQPTKFELVINLKTAKALGLTIPQSVLIRADEVIQ
jgi:putative ABC transport system substrate-binding protein